MLLLARRARVALVVNARRRRPPPPLLPPEQQQNQQPQPSSLKAKVHRRWASNGRRSGPSSWRSPLTHGVGPYSSSIEIQRQPPYPHQAIRGKKTTTVVSLDDLPQGLIRPGQEEGTFNDTTTSITLEDNEPLVSPAYPTVILQARRNMQKFDNCVLLTRVGGFYELYFEHAEEFGPLMNLKVAQKKTAAGPVPMVNKKLYFPFPLSCSPSLLLAPFTMT